MSGSILLPAVPPSPSCRAGLQGARADFLSIGSRLFLAILCSVLFHLRGARADREKHDLEHLVFEDCGMARMMLGHLPPDELEKGLTTLVSTIRLGTRGVGYGATGPGQLAGSGTARIPGHGELTGDIVLMSLDPGRNERARRCSIELLRSFLPARPLVLRELIALADDPDIGGADRALAEEIRRIVVSVAEEVAPQMSRGDAVLLLEPLIREEQGDALRHWLPLLRLFASDSLTLIGRKYITSPILDESLVGLLGGLDPSGEASTQLSEDALLIADDRERKVRALMLLRRVMVPSDRIVRLLLRELVAGSGDASVELLQTISELFSGQECRAYPRVDQSISSLLVQAVSSWPISMAEGIRTGTFGVRCDPQCEDESERTGLAALWCDQRNIEKYRAEIDELLRIDSSLLGTGLPAIATLELSVAELDNYLRQSLNSAHPTVRIAAFSLYSQRPNEPGKYVSETLRLLKRPTVTDDERREIVGKLARSFISPPIGIRGLPALPLFLEYFDRTSTECGLLCTEDNERKPLVVRAIGAIGKDGFPLLVRSLESPKKQRRRLALLALGELSPVDERMAYFLVGGLRDIEPELRDMSQQLVDRRQGEDPVRRELTKALKWSDADAVERVVALVGQ